MMLVFRMACTEFSVLLCVTLWREVVGFFEGFYVCLAFFERKCSFKILQ